MKLCTCNRVTNEVYDPTQCRLCWLYRYSQEGRYFFDHPEMREVLADRMATDALLLRKLVMPSPEPIDFCVPLRGANADVFAKVLFASLVKTNDLRHVTIHVVNKGVTDDVLKIVEKELANRDFIIHPDPPHPSEIIVGPNKDKHPWEGGTDVAFISDWMMRNAGCTKWCAICHCDLYFNLDIITAMRNLISHPVGMLGQQAPIMMINRDCYAQTWVGFADFSNFEAIPMNDGNGRSKIRHASDHRRYDVKIPISGFDTGEALELNIRHLGWVVHPMMEEISTHLVHFGGGSVYAPGHSMYENQRARAVKVINQRGY